MRDVTECRIDDDQSLSQHTPRYVYIMLDGSRWMLSDVFFFQAEDGIRDVAVTGVQTCALPISKWFTRYSAIARKRLAPRRRGFRLMAFRRLAIASSFLPCSSRTRPRLK